LFAVEVLVKVVVFTVDFDVEVDKVTIWGCFEDTVFAVVVTADTVEAKLLVAVVGTSRMYWTYLQRFLLFGL